MADYNTKRYLYIYMSIWKELSLVLMVDESYTCFNTLVPVAINNVRTPRCQDSFNGEKSERTIRKNCGATQ